MRLIDVDALIQEIIALRKDVNMSGWNDEYDRAALSGENDGLIEAENLAKHAPTIDAVPVIRCKDCKHYPVGGDQYEHTLEFPDEMCPCYCEDKWYSWRPRDNWFCANGERKEE